MKTIVKNEQRAVNSKMHGLRLVKPVVRVEALLEGLREGTTGRVIPTVGAGAATLRVLPRVWAVAAPVDAASAGVPAGAPAARPPQVEVAFYRKYTEALLRRYLRISMSAGRVPSMLGRELFRGHVTSYRVSSFEDAVIFCIDVEKCLAKLDSSDRELIRRIALQQYTQGEAAGLLGISLRHCIRQYGRALDRMTAILLHARLLEPQKDCQEPAVCAKVPSH